MVGKVGKLEIQSTVLGGDCVWIIPLENCQKLIMKHGSCYTHLQVLSCAIPNIHSLKVRIVTVVKRTPWGVELVREDQFLCRSVVRLASVSPGRSIAVDETCTEVLQERCVFFARDAERVVGAGCLSGGCRVVDKGAASD